MGRFRVAVLLVLSLLMSVGVLGAPRSQAEAQSTCATSFVVDTPAELDAAIACYNAAPEGFANTTIEFDGDIVISSTPTVINNTAPVPPRLLIDGNGYTLDGQDLAENVFRQVAGETEMTNITLARALKSGVEVGGDGFDIASGGSIVIRNSTITGNAVVSKGGSGVFSRGASYVVVINSTVTGNFDGVGVFGRSGNQMLVESSTIANNDGFAIFGFDGG